MKPTTALLFALLLTGCSILRWQAPSSLSGFDGWPVLAEIAPRWGHTATLLADGRVVVMGGRPNPARVSIYDPARDTWTQGADMPDEYHGHEAVALLDGRVFVYGGDYAGMAQSHAAVYDPLADRWIGGLVQEGVEGRADHTVDLLPDGRVLVAGGDHMGWSSLTRTDRAKTYDPAFSSPNVSYEVYLEQPIRWQCVARAHHASARLPDGSILLIGGTFMANPLDEVERFDPAANAFAPAEPMVFERVGATATALADGRILVTGGIGRRALDAPMMGRCAEVEPPPDGGVVVSFPMPRLPSPSTFEKIPPEPRHLGTSEIYDPDQGTWTVASAMYHPRVHHRATRLADGRVLVTGGRDEHGAVPHAELFDPVSGTWTLLPGMAHNREGHTATLLQDGRVLVIGGRDGDAVVGAVEVLETGGAF